jgi:hypothetical protein
VANCPSSELSDGWLAGIPARIIGKCTLPEPALETVATFPFPESGAAI